MTDRTLKDRPVGQHYYRPLKGPAAHILRATPTANLKHPATVLLR